MQALPSQTPQSNQIMSTLTLLLRLFEHLLDDLLLLNQECPDNAVADTVATSRSSVGALDGLLWAGDLGVLAGSESWDLEGETLAAIFLRSW